MKKALSLLLSALLLITVIPLAGFTASAETTDSGTCGENLTWELADGVLTISGTGTISDYSWSSSPWYSYRSSITEARIENGVTSIGYDAFRNCSSLTSITIPESVTSIGDSAFMNCSNLTSITIPDSVTSIGGRAFEYCSSLTSITIPESVTSIGYSAFADCSNLTSITIPESVTSIGEYAFSGCSDELIIYCFEDSYAAEYCENNDIQCEYIEHNENHIAEDPDSGIRATWDSEAFDTNIQLVVRNVQTELTDNFVVAGENTLIYDICFTDGEKEVEPNAPVTVKIPMPENMGTSVYVYHKTDDGKIAQVACEIIDRFIVFETDSFSVYIITDEKIVEVPSETTTEHTETTTEVVKSEFTLGDINHDGIIKANDARKALRFSAELEIPTEAEFQAADVNKDGQIRANDARKILRASADLEDPATW